MELHFTEETEGMNWLVLFVWKMRERLYIKSHEKLWKRTLKIKKRGRKEKKGLAASPTWNGTYK